MSFAPVEEAIEDIRAGRMVIVFSGSLIPLPLFPDWMQTALRLQPFAGLVDIPLRLYSGHLVGAAALAGLAQQALWSVALAAIGRIAMARVMVRLQVQGG